MPRLKIAGIAIFGLVLSFYPTLFSGFSRMQYDVGDTRFVGLILEHGYQWLTGQTADFWSPPFFSPAKGTLAFSENMIGSGPVYWMLRALGCDPLLAMQGWMIFYALANFLSFYALLGLGLRRMGVAADFLPRACGSFLFAFSNMRIAQLGHPQLLPQVFSVLALIGLVRSFSPVGKSTDLALFYLASAWQFLAAVYLGWFWFFCLSLAFFLMIFSVQARRTFSQWLKNQLWSHLFFAVLAAIILSSVALPYLKAGSNVGFRDFGQTLPMIAEIRTWFYLGPDSLIYGWVKNLPQYQNFQFEIEHRVGLGLFTWGVCLWGIFGGLRSSSTAFHKQARVNVAIFFSLLWVVFFHWKGRTLWYAIFLYFPGANAIRSVTRLSLFLLIPLSLGFSLAIARMRGLHWKTITIAGVVVICLLEQVSFRPSFAKEEIEKPVTAIAQKVRSANCRQFVFIHPLRVYKDESYIQLDAMDVALRTGVPTLNGYSGNYPPGWSLQQLKGKTRQDIEPAVRNWLEKSQLAESDVCWIEGE